MQWRSLQLDHWRSRNSMIFLHCLSLNFCKRKRRNHDIVTVKRPKIKIYRMINQHLRNERVNRSQRFRSCLKHATSER